MFTALPDVVMFSGYSKPSPAWVLTGLLIVWNFWVLMKSGIRWNCKSWVFCSSLREFRDPRFEKAPSEGAKSVNSLLVLLSWL
ncbi:hypothetical protein ACFX19_030209 [Malus domestica]